MAEALDLLLPLLLPIT